MIANAPTDKGVSNSTKGSKKKVFLMVGLLILAAIVIVAIIIIIIIIKKRKDKNEQLDVFSGEQSQEVFENSIDANASHNCMDNPLYEANIGLSTDPFLVDENEDI